MKSLVVSLIVFVAAMGGALVGIYLQAVIPMNHRQLASKEAIKVSTALIATMAAVVLGFMVSSAKDSYELKRRQLSEFSAMVLHLDRLLLLYGPEANKARDVLRQAVTESVVIPDSNVRSIPTLLQPQPILLGIYRAIEDLSPPNDDKRALKAAAIQVYFEMAQTRLMLLEEQTGFIEMAYVWILVLWIIFIFVGFGLFAPRNLTVVIAFGLSALSLSCAVFLILEMDHPFSGVLQISTDPLRYAVQNLVK